MGRISKSHVWPTNSKIALYKKEKDVLLYKETDGKGNVQTHKKDWHKCKATVIQGTPEDYLDRLEVCEDAIIWTCEINSRGRLSALTHDGKTYKNEDVTVLVHAK
jgi:hypothetical protein